MEGSIRAINRTEVKKNFNFKHKRQNNIVDCQNISTTEDGRYPVILNPGLYNGNSELVYLSQEIEEGNIEYKRQLVDVSDERLEQLTSQLKWRLGEGLGEAEYYIGYDDDGTPHGISDEDMESSIKTLKSMAESLEAEVFEANIGSGKHGKVALLIVRQAKEDSCVDVRIAVCGNVDAGKSTFIGVLTKGALDNGRGKARLGVFNFKHEVETGRTSSISQQILGFTADGKCINQDDTFHSLSWSDIVEDSYKIVSFIDLAGHEKYLKTTVTGMTGQMPDYCFLMIGANMGVTRMTKEHLGLSLSLKIPTIIIITKIDIAPQNILDETVNEINKILKSRGVRKIGLVIRNDEDFMTAVKSIQSDRIVPIFLVSNVTGKNLDSVRKFLNVLPPRIEWDLLKDQPSEVLVDETYNVTGVGTVVGGTVMSGTVNVGDTLLLGPDGNGAFAPVTIKSIHVKRTPSKYSGPGKSAGFAIKKTKNMNFSVRKGMVLVSPKINPKASTYFEADVVIMYHSTTIHKNYQPVVQCLTIRQAAKIVHIGQKDILRTGDKAKVIFKFMFRPEYLKVGMRLIFREGRCKGMGMVTRVCVTETEVKKITE